MLRRRAIWGKGMSGMAARRDRLRIGLVFCALVAVSAFSGLAGAADRVSNAQLRAAQEFLAAVASGDARAVAYAIHPQDLEALRQRILGLLQEEDKRGESVVRSRLFGPGMPLSEIERMTSIGLYTTLARRLHLVGRPYGDVKGIAAVPGRDGQVHLIVRGEPPRDRGKVEVIELVTVRPYGKDWKAVLPSEIEAQIDDLIAGRRSIMAAARSGALQPAGASTTSPRAPAPLQPGIVELLDAAERALSQGNCEEYYESHMSPNFRRVTGRQALTALINTCKNSLGTRQLLLSTLRILRGLEPRYQYEGQRAVFDLSGQGLPFERFVLEQVDRRWYIAE